MTQFVAIAKNSYLQAVRQPVYGIVVVVTLAGLALAPALTGWTLDDDNKMLRDIGLSTLLVQGLVLACFCASNVIDQEIEDRTALTVAAKPVSREVFIIGKYLGIFVALLTAHYLAGIALFMAMRHGVLETASDTSDVTVLLLGPAMMAFVAIMAGVLNYVRDYRYLPTLLALSVPALTFSLVVLLVIDRDFHLKSYEVKQALSVFPEGIPDESMFDGIVSWRPDPGNQMLPGHSGNLVRSGWQGPIREEERTYLLNLVDDFDWKRAVKFMVKESRDLHGFEVLKAGLLVIPALMLLASFAVAASTRLGTAATFLITVGIICMGLAADQVLRPMAEAGESGLISFAYRIIPNFQFYWMVDALNENRSIPLSYMWSASGYAGVYSLAVLLLAMGLYQTREIG